MGSNPNVISAVVGGQADLAVVLISFARPSLQRGDAKLIAYIGDETPWQLGGVLTATKIANERADTVQRRFLRAYKKGVDEYYDAFIAPDGTRRDGRRRRRRSRLQRNTPACRPTRSRSASPITIAKRGSM